MSGDHRSFRLAEKNKESFKVEMWNVLIIERNSYKRTFGRSTPRPQAPRPSSMTGWINRLVNTQIKVIP